jgi:hypothetical protein
MKAIDVHMEYLQCDADGCDHVETITGPITEALIGKACPKCGSNLLTADDFAVHQKLLAGVDFMNAALSELFPELADMPTPPDEEVSVLQVHHHDGCTTLKHLPPRKAQP